MANARGKGLNVEAKAMLPVLVRRDFTAPFLSCFLLALALSLPPRLAHAQGQTAVNLGAASTFAVLAGTTVTATTTTGSTVSGDLGVSPGTAVTGFPPGTVVNGSIHAGDTAAANAEAALTTAYNDAAGRTGASTDLEGNIGGQTLSPGLFHTTTSLSISSGNLTLNGPGVFIFQIASTLITSSSTQVILTGGATAANIFWQVGSSATLGTTSTFEGNILALTSITLDTGATLDGRALARNGAVSLDANSISVPTAVPEPQTFALVALGFGLIAWRRRVNRAV